MSRVNHHRLVNLPNMSRTSAERRPVQFVTNSRVGMHDYALTLHIRGHRAVKRRLLLRLDLPP